MVGEGKIIIGEGGIIIGGVGRQGVNGAKLTSFGSLLTYPRQMAIHKRFRGRQRTEYLGVGGGGGRHQAIKLLAPTPTKAHCYSTNQNELSSTFEQRYPYKLTR